MILYISNFILVLFVSLTSLSSYRNSHLQPVLFLELIQRFPVSSFNLHLFLWHTINLNVSSAVFAVTCSIIYTSNYTINAVKY